MAETGQVTFDPASQGYEEVFDPAKAGYEEVSFDPKSAGYEEVSSDSTPTAASNLSSLALSGAAEGGLQIISGATRVAQTLNPRLFGFLDTVAKEAGLATTGEFLGELGGATSRAEDEYGVDPKQKGFLPTLAKAAGSTLPTLASGPFAPYTTGLMMGEQGLEEAQQYGGDETQQAKAFLGNAATGFVTEKLLGLPAAMKSVKEAAKKVKMPDGTFRDLVKSVVKQIGLGFAREGSQETLEQLSQDAIAKYVSAYDPDRKVFDLGKLTTTFIAGGILGSGISGGLHIAENVSPESIAPKEEMQTQAEQIDQTLSNLAENPSAPFQTIAPEDIQNIPEGTPEDLQAAATPSTLQPQELTTQNETVPATPSEEVSKPIEIEEVKPSPDEAAKALQPYFNQAVEVARAAGALDPESAASQAQIDLSNQAGEGTTTLDNPKALLLEAAQNQARKQIEKEQAQKRGGGKVSTVEELPEVEQTRGPRAELVSKEEVGSIQEAVSRMPEGDQKVMRAMMEDPTLTLAELAEQTGLSEDQVSRAKRNARETLKQFVRSQGIGERMAPGASNIQELKRAQYIAASDIYEGLRQTGKLDRSTFEKNLLREYEDTFSPDDLDRVWAVAQEASEQYQESKGKKPFPAIISELTGATTSREGETSLANKYSDILRRERGLPQAMKAARRSQQSVWDEAMRNIDQNPQFQSELIKRLQEDPRSAINDLEAATLLHAQIKAEDRYARAVEKVNTAEGEKATLEAMNEARTEEANLLDLYDLSKIVGSEGGRALAFRGMLANRDYSISRMMGDLRADQGGVELSDKQKALVSEVSDTIQRTQSELETRTAQLEEKTSTEEYHKSVEEMLRKPTEFDSRILRIAEQIVSKLDSAADAARKRILARRGRLNVGLDPIALYDYAVIGASKIAHGLKDLAWKSSMREEFGEDVEPYLDAAYKEANERVDNLESKVSKEDRPKVRKAVRKEGSQDSLKDTKGKIASRLESGESLRDTRGLVQQMALDMVRSGINTPKSLLDALHPELEKFQPGISRREVMDLVSGYGDLKSLDMEGAKVQLRDLKGQMQQMAKLEDLQAGEGIKKTGIERRTPSMEEKRLIREVNEAKAKLGVGTLEAYKARLQNQIADLELRIQRKDFRKKPRAQLDISKDAEAVRLLAEKQKAIQRYQDARHEARKAAETAFATARRYGKETLGLARSIKSSFDFSAVGRQGGWLGAGHPQMAAQNLKGMFKSTGSEEFYQRSDAALKARPIYNLAKAAKLEITNLDGEPTTKEENFRSEWGDKVPGIRASNRAFNNYLNHLRMDVFQSIIGNLGFEPTTQEARDIANYINISTGRGDFGKWAGSAEMASNVLWSPRLLLSRIQLLTGQPLRKASSNRIRKAIAKEYARSLTGTALMMALGILAGATLEKDPRSSDFGKLKYGNTRIDPLFGLQQVSTFASRMGSATLNALSPKSVGPITKGDFKTSTGKMKYLGSDQKNRTPADPTTNDIIWRFGQSKATPGLGGFLAGVRGEKVTGEKTTMAKELMSLYIPMFVDDIVPLMKEQGVPKGAIIEVLNLAGFSTQTYDPKAKKNRE